MLDRAAESVYKLDGGRDVENCEEDGSEVGNAGIGIGAYRCGDPNDVTSGGRKGSDNDSLRLWGIEFVFDSTASCASRAFDSAVLLGSSDGSDTMTVRGILPLVK